MMRFFLGFFFLVCQCLPMAAVASERQTTKEMEELVSARKRNSENPYYLSHTGVFRYKQTEQNTGEFSIRKSYLGADVWVISGKIPSVKETREAWDLALKNSGGSSPKVVVLDSTGGVVESALLMSQAIRKNGIDVVIEDWGTCTSACVYILAAGKKRTISPWSLILVHTRKPSVLSDEKEIRGLAAKGSSLERVLSRQSHGLEDELLVPLSFAREQSESVAWDMQLVDGLLLYQFQAAGVSPLLLSYMSKAEHSSKKNEVKAIFLPCAIALALDNPGGNRTPESIQEIEKACDSLDYNFN